MKLKTRYKAALLVVAIATFGVASLLAARALKYAGGDVDPGTRDGALYSATQSGDILAMQVLLAVGASPVPRKGTVGYPILSVAASTGDLRAAKVLLRAGVSPDGADVIFNGTAEAVAPMLGGGATGPAIVATFDRPLFVAAARGHREMVDLLRKHGATYEPIDALFLGDESAVSDALERDPEVFSSLQFYGNTLLYAAAEYRNVTAARTLLRLGFDPNEPGRGGESVLAFVRRTGNAELIALFEGHTVPPQQE